MTAERYPLIASRGFRICRDNFFAPPGIKPDELRRVLTAVEREQLAAWAGSGRTRSSNGMFLNDLEEFLSRRLNPSSARSSWNACVKQYESLRHCSREPTPASRARSANDD